MRTKETNRQTCVRANKRSIIDARIGGSHGQKPIRYAWDYPYEVALLNFNLFFWYTFNLCASLHTNQIDFDKIYSHPKLNKIYAHIIFGYFILFVYSCELCKQWHTMIFKCRFETGKRNFDLKSRLDIISFTCISDTYIPDKKHANNLIIASGFLIILSLSIRKKTLSHRYRWLILLLKVKIFWK